MANLILVRGLPGSGKTTFVKKELPYVNHFEADMFFYHNDEYAYDRRFLQDAHNWCFSMAVSSLTQEKDVAVSNTFTTMREMEKYLKLKDIGVKITVVEVRSQYENIHGVPELTLQAMRNRWEEINWKKFGIESFQLT